LLVDGRIRIRIHNTEYSNKRLRLELAKNKQLPVFVGKLPYISLCLVEAVETENVNA
jgi:hypothetical protein